MKFSSDNYAGHELQLIMDLYKREKKIINHHLQSENRKQQQPITTTTTTTMFYVIEIFKRAQNDDLHCKSFGIVSCEKQNNSCNLFRKISGEFLRVDDIMYHFHVLIINANVFITSEKWFRLVYFLWKFS